jgi:hypothetical protein
MGWPLYVTLCFSLADFNILSLLCICNVSTTRWCMDVLFWPVPERSSLSQWESYHFIEYIFFFLCWGYIVAFTKVLTIYQMYHT